MDATGQMASALVEMGMRAGQSFRSFGERRLSELLEASTARLQERVNGEQEDYILNVNETEYIKHIVNDFRVSGVSIDFDGLTVSTNNTMVRGEDYPFGWNVRAGQRYPRPVFVFHLPVSGNTDLMQYRPDTWTSWHPIIVVQDGEIRLEKVQFNETPEQIKQSVDSDIDVIRTNYNHLLNQINWHNESLEQVARRTLENRKKQLLDRNGILAALGVPIKKRDNMPATYSVPTPHVRKPIIPRPAVSEHGYTPDPTLDEITYRDILQTVFELGKMFERLPATYRDKNEEALRDHLLLYLEPRYEGSATGETFNKTGKTDILIRHEGSNLFVAECKFWSGPKAYLDTISQLLGYLTWRDSKAAVLMFVRNREITPVVEAVKARTEEHENYLGIVSTREDSWFDFRFHINGDRNREVKVAVLLVHLAPA